MKMALTNESELSCIVCSLNVDQSNCTNIFQVKLPHHEETLVHFIQKILKLSISDLRSSYTCLECFNLFSKLEQAQWTVTNIQDQILKVFKGNGSQTIVKSEFIENEKIKDTENNSKNKVIEKNMESKVLIDEYSLKNDLNSLSNVTNQIGNDTVVPDNIKLETINESHMIVNEKNTEQVKLSNESVQKKVSFNLLNNIIININPNNTISSDEVAPESETSKSGSTSNYSQKPLEYICPTCNKKCLTSSELETHINTHSNQRPYMCEKCGQAYKHKHALEIHVGMHNGVSPFRCSYCNKCFTQKGALQRHFPMHTGDAPYQCELCGKRFIHHTSYNMHTLSHTGKKSYTCNVCDLSLLSTSHLKRHMRVHTGEKPYSCDFCNKCFAERYNLLAHQKIHNPTQISSQETKKKLHKCEQCEMSFSKKKKYNKHLKKHHVTGKNEEWLGHTIDVVDSKPANEGAYATAVNAVDFLETCVNEVWQSLSKD